MGLIDALRGRKPGKLGENESGYAPASEAVLERLWRRLESCPICGGDFAGHRFQLVATTILGPRNRRRIEKCMEAVERRAPGELVVFREWNGRGENAELYALRCIDGNIALAVVHSAATTPAFRNVLRCDSLGSTSSRELEGMMAEAGWREIVAQDAAGGAA